MPTAYRYVALLKELELLRQGPTGTYHPTARVMPIARAAQLANSVAQIGRPIVAETAARLRETVMLLQYLGDSVICIELAECDRAMRFTFQRGHSMPLGIGASGKMALACLPVETQAAKVPRLTADHELQRELAQAKARQYATSEAEVDEGVWACSVPVLVSGGGPFVLSVAGPAARIDDAAKAAALDVLRNSARRIRDGYEKYAL
jgi:DNA-binding IclR family transcriptional regulator